VKRISLTEFYKSGLFKKLKKTIIICFSVVSIIFLIAFTLGYFYEDTVKKIIIDQLNANLNTEIQVKDIKKDIEFSIFKKFPYASLHFKNVIAKDAIKNKTKGNLLEAKDVYLELSILDLIFKKYRIKNIEVNDAKIFLKTYKNKTDNYHFWKPSSDTVKDNSFFDLQKLKLSDVIISYADYSTLQDHLIIANKAILKGRFGDDNYSLKIEGNIYISHLKSNKKIIISKRNTFLDLSLSVDNVKNSYRFDKAYFNIGKLSFSITGLISYNKPNTYFDISVAGKKTELQSFIYELPKEYQSFFERYDCRGEFYFNSKIKGNLNDKESPSINARFGITNGKLIQKANGITLENLSFSAIYSNGSVKNPGTAFLTITDFKSRLNDGSLNGSIKIRNFDKPNIDLIASVNLNLADLNKFLKLDTIKSLTGRIISDFSYSGSINSFEKFTVNDFLSSKSSGSVKLENVSLEIKNQNLSYSNINGSFKFDNNDLVTENLSGRVSDNEFSFKGIFTNILPYIFTPNQKLKIEAEFNSPGIDLDKLLQFKTTSKDTTYKLTLTDDIDFKVKINIGKFRFRKFNASSISGNIIMKNRQLVANDVVLWSMDGKVKLEGLIDGTSPGKLVISCDASLSMVDVQKMFNHFENFGQKGIKEENIKGVVNANIQFASQWSNTFKVDPATIYAKTDISIEKGELVNYEILKGLSEYIKGRDFTRVRFATLKNSIEIKNKVITIPSMDIKSDAIDFHISGTHNFDNKIEYHLNMLFSDLKNPKDKTQGNEFGQYEDDGLGKSRYFFYISGTIDNPVYHKIDKEAYRESIKTTFKKEKENLKEILKKEFGIFKKDSVKKTDKKKQKPKGENEPEFNIDWDE
jgi:hypothetical protein